VRLIRGSLHRLKVPSKYAGFGEAAFDAPRARTEWFYVAEQSGDRSKRALKLEQDRTERNKNGQ